MYLEFFTKKTLKFFIFQPINNEISQRKKKPKLKCKTTNIYVAKNINPKQHKEWCYDWNRKQVYKS